MRAPEHAVTLSQAEIEALNSKLRELRHNVNNALSLIVAVSELLRRKPEMAAKLADSLTEPPSKITNAIKAFSADFEAAMRMTR